MQVFNLSPYWRLTLLVILSLSFVIPARANADFADAAFRELWQRTNQFVQDGRVARTWIWGPAAGFTTREPYAEGRDGTRLVQYFDKSRMEINNPDAPRNQWYVTNGLLVRELATGQIQVGDQQFTAQAPAAFPVAGDLVGNPHMPSYADFGRSDPGLAYGQREYKLLNKPADSQWYGEDPSGVVPELARRHPAADYAYYDDVTGHNVPGVFWRYLNAGGDVLENGRGVHAQPLVDWLYVVGHPITGAYWTRCIVGGHEQDVLVQLFERRVLTYTPANPPGWRVEMGNVGQHYLRWRYGKT